MKSKVLPDLQAVSDDSFFCIMSDPLGPETAPTVNRFRKLQQVNDSHDLFIGRDQLSPLLHVTDLHTGAVFIH